jgi:hypothetical protein
VTADQLREAISVISRARSTSPGPALLDARGMAAG